MTHRRISARVSPEGTLDLVSQYEVSLLADKSQRGLHELFRRCALAVLNSGSPSDDSAEVLKAFADFDIEVIQQPRGIKLGVHNAPSQAFVDGQMIKGIKSHLFAVLRDIVYSHSVLYHSAQLDLNHSENITNFIFHVLRNARVMIPREEPDLVVCWGGHSITREEYDYTKEVGHQLGLRDLDICTGCGPGAMKGPMKGATIAHAKQRIKDGRYLGITEPGIIAAEAPNPIVNELVIMPDIEKRLEAFVRLGHGIIVFPGGVGTAEEILYLLGILLHPDNKDLPFPVIFTGAKAQAGYFQMIDEFIALTLGDEARKRYQIIIDDPAEVARQMKQGIQQVTQFRRDHSDAFYFNWLLKIEKDFQIPFNPTHENMLALQLHKNQPVHKLAADLRRAFSGIVAGNVKADGIELVDSLGPFEIRGDKAILEPLEGLLNAFVQQSRMKLPGSHYRPSYRIVP